jgi:fatty acid-binding protein DegV
VRAIAGQLLSIKPFLTITDGEVVPRFRDEE